MPTAVWKGHISFGLVSIPVKVYRAARPEKVSFRQLHAATGARVRQTLVTERQPEPEEPIEYDEPQLSSRVGARLSREPEPFLAPSRAPAARVNVPAPQPEEEAEPASREVSRSEIVKGYEFEKDRYITLTRDELAALAPKTAREMQILEFIQLTEVDPIYYETSYYVAPDKGGERTYALLFEALRQSGLAGVAQVAMHNREHVIIIRPGRSGIVLHTMFYETEIRRDDEYRTEVSNVSAKELELALLLIRNLTAPFEPARYRDTYREKVEELIQAKIAGEEILQAAPPKPAPVVNILEALQRSLRTTAAPKPKPPVAERVSSSTATRAGKRRTANK